MSKQGKNKDYTVGYGKPPVETRFKKGQSGNPLGRPKNFDELRALIRAIGDEEMVGTRRTRIEAKARQLYASGKPQDILTLLSYGWGKPRDEVAAEIRGVIASDDFSKLSPDERARRIDELLERRGRGGIVPPAEGG